MILTAKQLERFWLKVIKTDTCWLWTAATSKGYGAFRVGTKVIAAHIISYVLVHGAVPNGLELDHICRNRLCVRPDITHLEPVPHQVNVIRGVGVTSRNYTKLGCKNGHPFSEGNTYITSRGWRQCRKCNTKRGRKQRQSRS